VEKFDEKIKGYKSKSVLFLLQEKEQRKKVKKK